MSLSSQMMGRDGARPSQATTSPTVSGRYLESPKIIRDLNSFVSRLSHRYLAAEPSMSLVPLAPLSTSLGMTRGQWRRG